MKIKKEDNIANRGKWLFHGLVFIFPVWLMLGIAHSVWEGGTLASAMTSTMSKLQTVSPIAFSFAVAIISYYILTIRAYGLNMRAAFFHKERIVDYELRILDTLNDVIDEGRINQLSFLFTQYEYNLMKLEDVRKYPGRGQEADFYRGNQQSLLLLSETRVIEDLGYYPDYLPQAERVQADTAAPRHGERNRRAGRVPSGSSVSD